MKKIRIRFSVSNKLFWIACGGAFGILVLLAALLFYPLMTREKSLRSGIDGNRRKIEEFAADKGKIHGKPEVESQKGRRGDLATLYRTLLGEFSKDDEVFERWFRNEAPVMVASYFDPLYQAQKELLRKHLREKVELGYEKVTDKDGNVLTGVSKLTPTEDLSWETDFSQASLEVLRKLQKRYWIREMVADAVLNSGARVIRLEDICFVTDPKTTAFKYDPVNVQQLSLPQWVEKDPPLPGNLGESIVFGVSMQIYYADVSKFITHLLSEAKPRIPEIKDQNYTDRDVEKPVIYLDLRRFSIRGAGHFKPEVSEEETLVDRGDKSQNEQEVRNRIRKMFGPHPVRLILTCEVLDFNAAEIEKKMKALNDQADGNK